MQLSYEREPGHHVSSIFTKYHVGMMQAMVKSKDLALELDFFQQLFGISEFSLFSLFIKSTHFPGLF